MSQAEVILEENLITQLTGIGYERIIIKDEKELFANLKRQLEKHNETKFSDKEFEQILNHLDKGNVFDRAKILRDKFALIRDDDSLFYIEFMNQEHWCQNQYQVTNQVTIEGSYKNRYDVTLLINGLPLIQIELKRRGLEMKEAFNQIDRYQRHSYWSARGLFQYVQIFVISNGVNTKYLANNKGQSFKQTFYWTDKDNNRITQLNEFTDAFLEKCHISKMIAKYTVLHETDKILMILRSYQYYAVEAIIDRVKQGNKNGYIWHTTGSGKTLTSFKAAQVIMKLPKVYKVVFVVDRADLDYQTQKEFDYFSPGCVDNTNNTSKLVDQITGDNNLIVTTIQKLNNAISNRKYSEEMNQIKDKRIVFIFDECHRSQFGDTHKRITNFFTANQMFGFTGTPIFKDNASKNELGKRTTKDLFEECLHKYVITDAIRDENVLRFSVEYWGKLKRRDGSLIDDEEVSGINKKEFYLSDAYISDITNWVINYHNSKTHNRKFTSIMCVDGIDAVIKYYDMFKAKREAGEHDLRIVTIFTYGVNEDDKDSNDIIEEPDFDSLNEGKINKHSRDKLEEYIADYNKMYKTKFSAKDSQGFYNYYKDIGKRIKAKDRTGFVEENRVDILLVVNMFLTGFDAKHVNTLYVDKNLKYHGLIQAYSRTNRILGEMKSQGNIVCFRSLKRNTDEAIKLFSDKNAQETIIMNPYDDYVADFNEAVKWLKNIAPTVDSVNDLISEEDELAFIKAFRNLMRIKNILVTFSEFSFKDLYMKGQEFEDYKSKYLDLYDKAKRDKGGDEGASIIEDVDFELELIQRDEINVTYILKLLAELYNAENSKGLGARKDIKKRKENILNLLNSDVRLRSKRELIEQFIDEYMPNITNADDIEDKFQEFWTEEKEKALKAMCKEEGLIEEEVHKLVEEYIYTGREPTRKITQALIEQPKVLERKNVVERVVGKIVEFVEMFVDDMG